MFIQVCLVAVAQPAEPEQGVVILDDIYTNDEDIYDDIVIQTKLIDALDSPLTPPKPIDDEADDATYDAYQEAYDKYLEDAQAELDKIIDTPDVPYLQNLVLQLRTKLAVTSAKIEPVIKRLETCDGFDDEVVQLSQIQSNLRFV